MDSLNYDRPWTSWDNALLGFVFIIAHGLIMCSTRESLGGTNPILHKRSRIYMAKLPIGHNFLLALMGAGAMRADQGEFAHALGLTLVFWFTSAWKDEKAAGILPLITQVFFKKNTVLNLQRAVAVLLGSVLGCTTGSILLKGKASAECQNHSFLLASVCEASIALFLKLTPAFMEAGAKRFHQRHSPNKASHIAVLLLGSKSNKTHLTRHAQTCTVICSVIPAIAISFGTTYVRAPIGNPLFAVIWSLKCREMLPWVVVPHIVVPFTIYTCCEYIIRRWIIPERPIVCLVQKAKKLVSKI
ncbi:unnamed protein product, partial [Mesorhabditis spiculigera]